MNSMISRLTRRVQRVSVASYVPLNQRYKGEELKQTCLRPGAYDAFAHPSLVGESRITYKGAKK